MKRKFSDIHHASDYLNHSLVRTDDGEPFFIDHLEGEDSSSRKWNAIGYSIKDRVRKRTSFPDLDFDPVPLGMMNYRDQAFFLSRAPRRMWKVGLTSRNLSLKPVSPLCRSNPGTSNSDLIITSHLYRTIMGDYPSFREVVEMCCIDKDAVVQAFSRNFALDFKGNIYYKDHYDIVGSVNSDGIYSLLPSYNYLEELLNKEINT